MLESPREMNEIGSYQNNGLKDFEQKNVELDTLVLIFKII